MVLKEAFEKTPLVTLVAPEMEGFLDVLMAYLLL